MNDFQTDMALSRRTEEIDMTPMVDVTFLLLIFFMVTASFTLQAAMDFKTKERDEPSPFSSAYDDKPEFVSVFISPENEFRVRTPEHDWLDAPNKHELRVLLAEAQQGPTKPEKLLIIAHADCWHSKVIDGMDIGTELSFKIQLRMSSDLY